LSHNSRNHSQLTELHTQSQLANLAHKRTTHTKTTCNFGSQLNCLFTHKGRNSLPVGGETPLSPAATTMVHSETACATAQGAVPAWQEGSKLSKGYLCNGFRASESSKGCHQSKGYSEHQNHPRVIIQGIIIIYSGHQNHLRVISANNNQDPTSTRPTHRCTKNPL
jgi:hypothetical protein